MNDSSTGGYLTPTSSAPAYDLLLDRILQPAVIAIVGFTDATLVRPRWQTKPPPQPEPGTDWCAIGVHSIDPDDGPAIIHDGTGDGSSTVTRHETIDYLASFYGPNAMGNAARLRDGFSVNQNVEAIEAVGLRFVSISPAIPAPALVNEQWVRKFDVHLTFRRAVTRIYPILNLLSVVGTIQSDTAPDQPFDVEL